MPHQIEVNFFCRFDILSAELFLEAPAVFAELHIYLFSVANSEKLIFKTQNKGTRLEYDN